MAARNNHGYPVLILGGGRGGAALLEMFAEDEHVTVIGIVDPWSGAPGIKMAQSLGIRTFSDVTEALPLCKAHPDCIVYNLTHDDSVAEVVSRAFGDKKVTSGPEAKLFWQIVTNLKRIKGELEQSQNQLNAIITHAMDGIFTLSEYGTIQGFNPAAEAIFGYRQEEIIGKHVKTLLSEETQTQFRPDIQRYLQSGLRGGVGIRGQEVVALRKNGENFPMEVSASEMEIQGQRFFIAIVRDVTERKAVEQKIQRMAHYDHLTGLPNRGLFMDRLRQAILRARRERSKSAILFLDLDGFKQVNDTLGHEAGDQLLKEVATRLTGIIRESDTVGRMGGDEFTLILNNVSGYGNAAATAQKIIDVLAVRFDLKGQACHVGGSIGIALYPDDDQDHEALLRMADEAMYDAKKNGKNIYRLFRDLR
jgi:diguanylate cyclase (GGDEF)-like protein/PAS domain S-box-containing protein